MGKPLTPFSFFSSRKYLDAIYDGESSIQLSCLSYLFFVLYNMKEMTHKSSSK